MILWSLDVCKQLVFFPFQADAGLHCVIPYGSCLIGRVIKMFVLIYTFKLSGRKLGLGIILHEAIFRFLILLNCSIFSMIHEAIK